MTGFFYERASRELNACVKKMSLPMYIVRPSGIVRVRFGFVYFVVR